MTRALIAFLALNIMLLGFTPHALAQADAGQLPPNYVPLPPGMETEPLETYLEGYEPPLPPAPVVAPPPAAAAAVTDVDLLALCRGQVGYDSDRALINCLADHFEQSEQIMAAAGKIAHDQAAATRKDAVRALASSNMAYNAFRDAECARQIALPQNSGNRDQIRRACLAELNYVRARLLAGR